MITTRDLQVVDFLNEFKVARTGTLSKLFYPSPGVAYRRLQQLVKDRHVKRYRDSVSSDYLYFTKQPRQLKHDLLLTDFYAAAPVRMVSFRKEYSIGGVRADALMVYQRHKAFVAFVEIELSNKGVDIAKYERLYDTGECQSQFKTFPKIIVVTDRKIPESYLPIIHVGTDLRDINMI